MLTKDTIYEVDVRWADPTAETEDSPAKPGRYVIGVRRCDHDFLSTVARIAPVAPRAVAEACLSQLPHWIVDLIAAPCDHPP